MSASDPSAPGLPLAGGGSGTITAADITDATAVGEALLTAANEAAGRDAIDAAATVTTTRGDMIRRGASADERVAIGASGTVLTSNGTDPVWAGAPATLADQQRADALRRRGPLAMRSTGVQGVTTATTGDSTPSVLLSTSGVVTIYSTQAGGYANVAYGQNGLWGTRGWYMSAFGSTLRIGLMKGVVETIDFTTALAAAGWHSLAWSVAADGNSVRYSLDGAAVATATLSTTPLAPVARNAADAMYIGTNSSTNGTTPTGLAYLAFWESLLPDGDLITLATAPSAGAPTLPSTPSWEWAAAAFSGVEAVTIDGSVYTVVGAPVVWMP